jgi:excisionase family DNA binding protein
MEETLRRDEGCLTVSEVAERLKLNEETVRRLFMTEPGVIVIYRPRKGRRQYRTLRISRARSSACREAFHTDVVTAVSGHAPLVS